MGGFWPMWTAQAAWEPKEKSWLHSLEHFCALAVLPNFNAHLIYRSADYLILQVVDLLVE